VLFATILIHELGHIGACRCVGGHADGVLMWPLGGLALLGHNSGPKGDLWVSAAGPLTHLPMTAAWLAGLWAARVAKFGPGTPLTLVGMYPPSLDFLAVNVCNGAVILNIAICVFNLLPAFPLDGGRMFIDALLMCRVSARSAAIASCVVSTLACLGIIIYACIPPVNAMLLLITVFILLSVFSLAQAIRMKALRYHPLFAYTFKEGEMPADLAAEQQQQQGSSLPVFGHPVAGNAQAYPSGYPLPGGGAPAAPPARSAGNPFAGQAGAAAAAQQAAQAPLPWAQHAAYAPAQPPAR
jgi:Zn-dependent protease